MTPMPAGRIQGRNVLASLNTPKIIAPLGAAAALAGAAIVVGRGTAKAERDNPPAGRFLDVDGVRLHYIDRGEGETLVLLHGTGMMLQDFVTSGLIDLAAKRYRVIAFDRPGFGFSARPRKTIWTGSAQADLISAALTRLGIDRATVLGHSTGASIAIALGLRHPEQVSGLVLAGGYYYPSVLPSVMFGAWPAHPMPGGVMRNTVPPHIARLAWRTILRNMFGPAATPARFVEEYPIELALRLSQMRAITEEAGLVVRDALALAPHYGELAMPVSIVAGRDDRVVDPDEQAGQLHRAVPHSTLHLIEGSGHMVHHTGLHAVMAVIDRSSGSPT